MIVRPNLWPTAWPRITAAWDGLSALMRLVAQFPWGVAPCWYGRAPLALGAWPMARGATKVGWLGAFTLRADRSPASNDERLAPARLWPRLADVPWPEGKAFRD
jgi:hypothetical protein